MNGFRKRFFTPRRFARDLKELLIRMPEVRKARRAGRVSRPFAEKLMLAVTAVNGCRYCARFHTKLALEEGVSPQEIQALLTQEIGQFVPEEAVALAFAQHWAEMEGNPDPEVEQRFRAYYGPATSADILAWLRTINFGNLAGNTADAILWRLGIGRSPG